METVEFLGPIFQNIISPDLQRALLPVRIIFIIISILLIVGIFWLLKVSSFKNFWFLDKWNDYKLLKKHRRNTPMLEAPVKEEVVEEKVQEVKPEKIEISDWDRILDKLRTKDELKCKLALLDADRLLDKSLGDRKIKSLGNAREILKIKDYLERLLDKPRKGITLRNATNILGEY